MDVRNTRLIYLCVCATIVAGRMRLHSHGYENVVISIGSHVREDPELIKRLQQYLTVTSQALFKATRNQIYFRDFIVVIPEKWQNQPHYESATDADIDHAQFVIDKANPAYGEAPYVKQYAECGQPGLFIHLTPNYLIDDDVTFRWGLPEKTLVHEWAHLRWGLFDEYPIDPQDTPFYRHGGKWQPVRCSSEVEGVLRSEYTKGECPFDLYTGRPGMGCKFYPRMKSNKAASSMMFMQYLESITEFCDDPFHAPAPYRHNVFAPNRQNRLCNYRSAWEVMRKHEDFRKIVSPLPRNTDTTPRFHFVQVRPRRRVLVLDASGSMTGSSMNILRQAASNYIMTSVESNSWLGIVQFNTNAKVLSPLLEVKSDVDRRTLVNRLPTFAEGKTSIGAGLGKGLRALDNAKMGKGGTIILITDGKENKSPWIKDIKPQLQKNGIMVHSLAYTQHAEASIAQLAGETEGRTFFFTGESNSTSLIDGLAATLPSKGDNSAASIMSEARRVYSSKPHTGSFIIDSTIGRDTTISITHTSDIDVRVIGPGVTLTKADNTVAIKDNSTYDVLTVVVPGIAAVGQWVYTISTKMQHVDIVVHVKSRSRSADLDVIRVESWLSTAIIRYDAQMKFTAFADVTKGRAPVLGAKVKAVLEGPESMIIDIVLLDDGIGSDLIKDDGVYSSYVLAPDVKGNGRYSVKVKVIGDNLETKVIIKGHQTGALALGSTGNEEKAPTETIPLDAFQRVTTAGEFRLEGYPAVPPKASDVIPPAKIGDLTVVSFDQDIGLLRLQWTSVGDDMGRGQASGYKIHLTTELSDLVHNIDSARDISNMSLGETLTRPKSFGIQEQLDLDLKFLGPNDTVFLAIRAFDEADNIGDVSNIVSVSHVDDVAIPRALTHPVASLLKQVMAPLIGCLLLIVLVTIGCIVSSAIRQRRARKKKALGESTVSLQSITSEFPHMNYTVNGEYVQRWREEHASWNM